jgi:hypothetical protein
MIGQDKESLVRFRKNVRLLISQHIREGQTIDGALEGVADKWNPLFDSVNRRNLLEDVNALARDFLRPVRASLLVKPLNFERIQDLAEQLSTSKALAKISKRELLRRYLVLYILRCLSEF